MKKYNKYKVIYRQKDVYFDQRLYVPAKSQYEALAEAQHIIGLCGLIVSCKIVKNGE